MFQSATPSVDTTTPLPPWVVDFIKISSLTGLDTADWPEDTQQQENNETVSYQQFGTIL